MSQSIGLNQRLDPYKNFKFRLILDNRTYTGSLSTGLIPPLNPADYRPGENPVNNPRQIGRSKYRAHHFESRRHPGSVIRQLGQSSFRPEQVSIHPLESRRDSGPVFLQLGQSNLRTRQVPVHSAESRRYSGFFLQFVGEPGFKHGIVAGFGNIAGELSQECAVGILQ